MLTDSEIEEGIAHLDHGFMTPQIWREAIGMDGGGNQVPVSEVNSLEPHPPRGRSAWWCKLSASGYMDQTDTSGPFKTERDAAEYLCEMYADDIQYCDECRGDDNA